MADPTLPEGSQQLLPTPNPTESTMNADDLVAKEEEKEEEKKEEEATKEEDWVNDDEESEGETLGSSEQDIEDEEGSDLGSFYDDAPEVFPGLEPGDPRTEELFHILHEWSFCHLRIATHLKFATVPSSYEDYRPEMEVMQTLMAHEYFPLMWAAWKNDPDISSNVQPVDNPSDPNQEETLDIVDQAQPSSPDESQGQASTEAGSEREREGEDTCPDRSD